MIVYRSVRRRFLQFSNLCAHFISSKVKFLIFWESRDTMKAYEECKEELFMKTDWKRFLPQIICEDAPEYDALFQTGNGGHIVVDTGQKVVQAVDVAPEPADGGFGGGESCGLVVTLSAVDGGPAPDSADGSALSTAVIEEKLTIVPFLDFSSLTIFLP